MLIPISSSSTHVLRKRVVGRVIAGWMGGGWYGYNQPWPMMRNRRSGLAMYMHICIKESKTRKSRSNWMNFLADKNPIPTHLLVQWYWTVHQVSLFGNSRPAWIKIWILIYCYFDNDDVNGAVPHSQSLVCKSLVLWISDTCTIIIIKRLSYATVLLMESSQNERRG